MNGTFRKAKLLTALLLTLILMLALVACGMPGTDKKPVGTTSGIEHVDLSTLVADVELIETVGFTDTYRVTFANNETIELSVVNGRNGVDGQNGKDGRGVKDVKIGPSGNLVIKLTDDEELTLGNVMGKDGKGIKKVEINAEGILSMLMSDETSVSLGNVRGADGVGIKDVSLSTEGKLLITLTSDRVLDLGIVKGEKGDPGKSAYEIYKEVYGYSGSEQDWIADLTSGNLATRASYTVTFDTADGSAVPAQQVLDGKKAKLPPDPTREGYLFAGWYYYPDIPEGSIYEGVTVEENAFEDEDGRWLYLWDFRTTVTEDLALYAVWEETVTVSFDLKGAPGKIEDLQLIKGDYYSKYDLPRPEWEGYAFMGWFLGDRVFHDGPIEEDITLTAKWGKLHTVTFLTQDGSAVPSQQVIDTFLVFRPEAPTHPTLLFDKWLTEDGTEWDFHTPVTSDLTLVASWCSPDPWEQISAELGQMDASLRNIIIHMSETTASGVKNKDYVEGPANREGASTLQGYIYDRNHEAYERLGLTITYTYNDWAWGAAYTEITYACNATQTEKSPDMYVDLMYDMVGATLSGVFREITSIEGSYLNFETRGWFNDIMSDVSFDREHLYLLSSDYYLDTLRNMFVMPFNLSLVDSLTGDEDLVAAIVGGEFSPKDEDGNRQYLSDFLFQLVRDGKWTFDKLTEICEAIYNDSDSVAGDTKDDAPLGLLVDKAGGYMSSAFLYSTDTQCIVEGTDAAGKLTMTYPETGDAINAVFLATDKLLSAKGTFIMPGDYITANQEIRKKFSAGEAFAIAAELLGTFESDEYTQMTDIFSVLPLPLLVEGSVDDHNTPIHNCAPLGGINIKSARFLPITAFLQYVTEHELTQSIRLEYCQIIMRYDLFEYNADTDEMLDIIYNHVKSCREMIVDNIVYQQHRSILGRDKRWHGILKSQSFLAGSFLTDYEGIRGPKQVALDALLEQWRTLPTQEIPAE